MPQPVLYPPSTTNLRLHMASMLYFLSRLAVVTFVFGVPALYFLWGQVHVPLVLGGAAVVTLIFVSYYAAAGGLRCPTCRGPVLMDNGNRKHRHARKLMGLNHRARVAWDILFKTAYQCMYCHTRFGCKHRNAKATAPTKMQASALPPAPVPEESAPGVGGPWGRRADETARSAAGADPNASAASHVSVKEAAPLFPVASVLPSWSAAPVCPASPLERVPVPTLPKINASSVPWTSPIPPDSPPTTPPMNRPSHDHEPAHGPNPFLAAAAAMPPPPSPMLPYIPQTPPRNQAGPPAAESSARHQDESRILDAATPSLGGPPPWTLPALAGNPQRTAAPHGAALPATPESAGAAQPLHPAPFTTFAPVSRPMSQAPAGGVPLDLVRDVVGVLHDGRRALTDAFEAMIGKLESRLAACEPAAPSAPVSQPSAPSEGNISGSVPMKPTAILPPRGVSPAPPEPKTTLLPLPPVPANPPAPPVMENPFVAPVVPIAPRRKFPRPAGVAAQELNTTLNEAFEAPAPSPNGNGHSYGNGKGSNDQQAAPFAASLDPGMQRPAILPRQSGVQQRGAVPVSPFGLVHFSPAPTPASHPPIYDHQTDSSQFAVAGGPLTSPPPGMPAVPAPFTFLESQGDHFAPLTSRSPVYDSLDDTPLPWMQPLGGQNNRV